MADDTVNKKNKKTGKAAGKEDKDAMLTCISMANQIRDEIEEEWELEAIGILKTSIMESLKDKGDYVVLKAYVTESKKEHLEKIKDEEGEK